MPPLVTLATPADLPGIHELLVQSRLPQGGLAQHLGTTLVARADGRIVGSAALELYGRAALLRSVAVEAGLRSRGLGHELTRRALELARRRGVTTVYLITTTAGKFFPRFGFTPVPRAAVPPDVQRSAQFTHDCPATALVMARALA